MAYYCGNTKGQSCDMHHKTLKECLQECNRLQAHFGGRFEPYDVQTRKPVDLVRQEP